MRDEVFDFKPFFDMILGMLFILIIMVASGILFQQFQPADDPSRLAREKQNLYNATLEAEITDFLKSTADEFKKAGAEPELDLIARSISFPTAKFLSIEDKSGEEMRARKSRFQLLDTQIEALTRCQISHTAAMVQDTLTSTARAQPCAMRSLLRLEKISISAALTGKPATSSATPTPSAQNAQGASQNNTPAQNAALPAHRQQALANGMFMLNAYESAPHLLNRTNAQGQSLLDLQENTAPLAAERLRLTFAFTGAQASKK